MKELKEKLDTILESPKMWSAFQLTREELEHLRSLMGDGWVKCSDRLPDNDREVLVYAKYEEIPIQAFYLDGKWRGSFAVRDAMSDNDCGDSIFHTYMEVTHWRELPNNPTP